MTVFSINSALSILIDFFSIDFSISLGWFVCIWRVIVSNFDSIQYLYQLSLSLSLSWVIGNSLQLYSNQPQCQKNKLWFHIIIVISKSARCQLPTRTQHPSIHSSRSQSPLWPSTSFLPLLSTSLHSTSIGLWFISSDFRVSFFWGASQTLNTFHVNDRPGHFK